MLGPCGPGADLLLLCSSRSALAVGVGMSAPCTPLPGALPTLTVATDSTISVVVPAAGMTGPAWYADSPLLRLRWLVQLRWAALAAAVLGLLVARVLRLPFVSPAPIAAAILVGVLYNTWFLFRLARLESAERAPATEASDKGTFGRELELQAIADVGALTLLLAACGGLRNPFSAFFGFHIVLGTVLGLLRGAVLAGAVSFLGVLLLLQAERAGLLLAPVLLQPPLWLCLVAAALNILSLGYFAGGALRFWQRAEGRALRSYGLLLNGLDELHVGLELVGPGDRLLLANRRAAALHPTPAGRWQAPQTVADDDSPGRRLIRAASGEPGIFEVVALSPAPARSAPAVPAVSDAEGLRAYLYIDRTEVTVSEQRAMMLERLASQGRVLQQVAHELNTPLATIQTLAVDLSHVLTDPEAPIAGAPLAADTAESIALIIDEARRCRAITHDLLATARPGSPAESARRKVVLQEVIARAARLAYGSRRGAAVDHQVGVSGALGARIRVSGPGDLSCISDGDRLLQILVNLLQNARDASDEPVDIELSREPFAVVLRVRDQGPGLPAEVRERLFTPFVTTKPPGQGTGLGLYTCSLLARQLGAELNIASPLGGGVVATLRLPAPPEGQG